MVVTKLTYLTFFCVIYMIILLIIYFSKERIKNSENKVYTIMMISNIFGLIFQTLSLYFSYHYYDFPVVLSNFIIKLFLFYFVFFAGLLFIYVIVSANKQYKYKALNVTVVVMVLSFMTILFLPMSMHLDFDNLIFYSTGPACTFIYVFSVITSLSLIVTLTMYRKIISRKKMIPLIMYLLLTVFAIPIQKNNPDVMIICYIESLVCFLMFHTIENPDMIMVEELTKAQKLSEQTNNEKSNFIYIVSEDIANRLSNADKVYENVMSLDPDNEIKEYMYDLKDIISGARNMLRRTIDISDMDNKHLQITNNKYNVKLLLESVYTLKKQELKPNVDFKMNISDDLPAELYGDSIKLKQIITTVLDNSINYTEKGFIELRVNSFIKNDICRLIISVEDSGKGIDIYKQNEIMNNSSDLTKEEIDSLDNMNLNLKTIRKMISVIGGTFTIDNNKYNGTTVNITLDQKFYKGEKSEEEKNIEKYSESIKNQKNCAVITLDKDALKTIKASAKKNNFKVEEFNITKTCLDNIRNNKHYDLIFIDELMEKIDARSFLKKVKEVEGFNGKVIVVSKSKDIKNKKELLDLGFESIVYNPIDKKELDSKLKNI